MHQEPIDGERLEAAIGQRMRILRKRQGLTLEQVSKQTQLSKPLLSQIEHGHVNLSIANLWKIAQALGAEVASFFPRGGPEEGFELVRAGTRKKVTPSHASAESPGYSHEHVASFHPEGGVEVFMVEIDALARQEVKFNTHPGVELALVMEGDVEFLSKGSYRVTLHPGDTLQFPAEYPHAYRGLEGKAKLLAILYAPFEPSVGEPPKDCGTVNSLGI